MSEMPESGTPRKTKSAPSIPTVDLGSGLPIRRSPMYESEHPGVTPGMSPTSPSMRSFEHMDSSKKSVIGSQFIKTRQTTKELHATVLRDSPIKLIRKLVNGGCVANMMALIVLSDAAATCFDIDARAQKLEASLVVLWISDICLIMYILELILVTIARGFRTFKELSTLLDVFIISCGVLEKVLMVFSVGEDIAVISMTRILRLVRIFRLARLLQRTKSLRELSKLVRMMATCLKALAWSFIFCFMIMTVWAMLMVELIHPLVKQLYGDGIWSDCGERCLTATASVMDANLLLFKTVIAGDSWGEIAVPVIQQFPATAIIFMGSLLTLVFGVLNLIVAVVVDTFAEARQRDVLNLAEELEFDLANDKKVLQRMFDRMDADGSGCVTFEELVEGARADAEFQSRLRVMDIDEADLQQLFEMIDSSGQGEIESAEFIAALSRWVHDSKTAPRFVKYNMLRSLQLQDAFMQKTNSQFEVLAARMDYMTFAMDKLCHMQGVEEDYFGDATPNLVESRISEESKDGDIAVDMPEDVVEQPRASLQTVTMGAEVERARESALDKLERHVLRATETALKQSFAMLEADMPSVTSGSVTRRSPFNFKADSLESSMALRGRVSLQSAESRRAPEIARMRSLEMTKIKSTASSSPFRRTGLGIDASLELSKALGSRNACEEIQDIHRKPFRAGKPVRFDEEGKPIRVPVGTFSAPVKGRHLDLGTGSA